MNTTDGENFKKLKEKFSSLNPTPKVKIFGHIKIPLEHLSMKDDDSSN